METRSVIHIHGWKTLIVQKQWYGLCVFDHFQSLDKNLQRTALLKTTTYNVMCKVMSDF